MCRKSATSLIPEPLYAMLCGLNCNYLKLTITSVFFCFFNGFKARDIARNTLYLLFTFFSCKWVGVCYILAQFKHCIQHCITDNGGFSAFRLFLLFTDFSQNLKVYCYLIRHCGYTFPLWATVRRPPKDRPTKPTMITLEMKIFLQVIQFVDQELVNTRS